MTTLPGVGGENAQFYSEEEFSMQVGKSFSINCRDGFVVSSNRFRIIPINTQLTTLWIKVLPNRSIRVKFSPSV